MNGVGTGRRSVTVTFTSTVAVDVPPVIVWPSVGGTPVSNWIHIFVAAVVELIASIWPVPPVHDTGSTALNVPVGVSTSISWVMPRNGVVAWLRPYTVSVEPRRVSHFVYS